MDLIPTLPLHLLHGSLHLRLGDGVEAAESPLAIESLKPGLVHVVQVIAAHLFRAEHHGGHLVSLGPVRAGGVHADQLPGQGESLALDGWDHSGHMGLGKPVGLDRDLDAPLPLLLPGVLDLPVVIRLQRLVVGKLHSGDEVFAEELQQNRMKNWSRNKIIHRFCDRAVGPPVVRLARPVALTRLGVRGVIRI